MSTSVSEMREIATLMAAKYYNNTIFSYQQIDIIFDYYVLASNLEERKKAVNIIENILSSHLIKDEMQEYTIFLEYFLRIAINRESLNIKLISDFKEVCLNLFHSSVSKNDYLLNYIKIADYIINGDLTKKEEVLILYQKSSPQRTLFYTFFYFFYIDVLCSGMSLNNLLCHISDIVYSGN